MGCSCDTKVSDLKLRIAVQTVEMASDKIRRGAMREFGLTENALTSNDLAAHYVNLHRAQEISELLSEKNYKAVGERLGYDPRTLPPMRCLSELWEEYHQHRPGVSTPLLLLRPDLASFH